MAEHALLEDSAKSRQELYVAPGNAGTAQWNVPLKANDFDSLVQFARENAVDLTIVGPEEPLSLGLVDAFLAADLKIFGPTKEAAQLESSKAFAKKIMEEAKVPTARYQTLQK